MATADPGVAEKHRAGAIHPGEQFGGRLIARPEGEGDQGQAGGRKDLEGRISRHDIGELRRPGDLIADPLPECLRTDHP